MNTDLLKARKAARVFSVLCAIVLMASSAAHGFASQGARATKTSGALTSGAITAGGGAAGALPDMTGHWGETYVRELFLDGVVSGMEDGLFHPDQEVTGAQFVKMIVESEFGAVPPTAGGDWASGYLARALDLEFITPEDIAKANDPITRLDAARIGYVATSSLWNEPDVKNISAAAELKDLYDCEECVYTVAQMYVKGVIAGYPDGAFHGYDTLTRAESAVLIVRLRNPERRVPQTIDPPAADGDGKITPEQANDMISTYGDGIVLIDVRTPDEYAAGFIEGAVNIPLTDLARNIDNLGMYMVPEEKDAVILLYCSKGVRSMAAKKAMSDAGYENVYYFGDFDAWPGEISSTK